MKFRTHAFIAIVTIQILFLIVTAASSRLVIAKGETVKILCVPVDPRSLVSGDYVDLRYSISTISAADFTRLSGGMNLPASGDTLFVRLSRTGAGFAEIAAIDTSDKVFKKEKALFVKARVAQSFSDVEPTYGIEQYYVPQFKGLAIESSRGSAHVEAAVDKSGRIVLKSLFIEGKAVQFY